MRSLRPDALPLAELHRKLWGKIDYTIRATITGDAGSQVLDLYLSMQADDGFADGTWHTLPGGLRFSFSDAAGLCNMSSAAALHWLEVVPRTDSFLRRELTGWGWELDEDLLKPVLEARSPTLVELRGQYYYVSRTAPRKKVDDDDFYSDDGIERLQLAALSAEERLSVEAAAYSGRCGCEYCRNVLPFVLVPPLDYDGSSEHVPAAWRALDAIDTKAAVAELNAYGEAQWKAEPNGPAAFTAVREALKKQNLEVPISRLVPMLLQR